MASEHFDIQPEDGWVEITGAGVDFVAIRQNPRSGGVFILDTGGVPALTDVGFKIGEEFVCNVPVTTKIYARVTNPKEGVGTRVYVFSVPT